MVLPALLSVVKSVPPIIQMPHWFRKDMVYSCSQCIILHNYSLKWKSVTLTCCTLRVFKSLMAVSMPVSHAGMRMLCPYWTLGNWSLHQRIKQPMTCCALLASTQVWLCFRGFTTCVWRLLWNIKGVENSSLRKLTKISCWQKSQICKQFLTKWRCVKRLQGFVRLWLDSCLEHFVVLWLVFSLPRGTVFRVLTQFLWPVMGGWVLTHMRCRIENILVELQKKILVFKKCLC